MSAPTVMVCTACGTRVCFLGFDVCPDALRADVAPCSCEWTSDEKPSGSGAFPLIINPGCYIHGEPS